MTERPKAARGVFALLAGPPLVWLALFFVLPLVIILGYALGENRSLTDIAITGSFRNFGRALQPVYLGVLGKSLWFAALTTIACLVIGFPVAMAIAFAPARWRLALLLLVMLPFWVNLLIRTYALMAVLRPEGYINSLIKLVWPAAWLGDFVPLDLLHNNAAVIIGLVYVQLPFMVLPLYAALDRLDRSLIEASLDLGAGQLTSFARITVPLAMPGIIAGIIITFVPTLGAYLTPDLLGGTSSQMIANVIDRQFRSANDWPFGAALSFILMALALVAMALQGLVTRRGRA